MVSGPPHPGSHASGDLTPFDSDGDMVEVDETFIGVDRTTSHQCSMVLDRLKVVDLFPILKANILAEDRVMTNEAGHAFIRQGSCQYVDYDDPTIRTNTIEELGFLYLQARYEGRLSTLSQKAFAPLCSGV